MCTVYHQSINLITVSDAAITSHKFDIVHPLTFILFILTTSVKFRFLQVEWGEAPIAHDNTTYKMRWLLCLLQIYINTIFWSLIYVNQEGFSKQQSIVVRSWREEKSNFRYYALSTKYVVLVWTESIVRSGLVTIDCVFYFTLYVMKYKYLPYLTENVNRMQNLIVR